MCPFSDIVIDLSTTLGGTTASAAVLVVVGDGTGAGLAIPMHATNAPSGTPAAGSIFLEKDLGKLWIYDGTAWKGTLVI